MSGNSVSYVGLNVQRFEVKSSRSYIVTVVLHYERLLFFDALEYRCYMERQGYLIVILAVLEYAQMT